MGKQINFWMTQADERAFVKRLDSDETVWTEYSQEANATPRMRRWSEWSPEDSNLGRRLIVIRKSNWAELKWNQNTDWTSVGVADSPCFEWNCCARRNDKIARGRIYFQSSWVDANVLRHKPTEISQWFDRHANWLRHRGQRQGHERSGSYLLPGAATAKLEGVDVVASLGSAPAAINSEEKPTHRLAPMIAGAQGFAPDYPTSVAVLAPQPITLTTQALLDGIRKRLRALTCLFCPRDEVDPAVILNQLKVEKLDGPKFKIRWKPRMRYAPLGHHLNEERFNQFRLNHCKTLAQNESFAAKKATSIIASSVDCVCFGPCDSENMGWPVTIAAAAHLAECSKGAITANGIGWFVAAEPGVKWIYSPHEEKRKEPVLRGFKDE